MINSIQNGDPLHVIAQVSLARNEQNAPPTLKDPKFWTAEEKKTQNIDRLARSLLIQGLLNDIYSLIDSNETAKDLWDALKRKMRGSEYGEQDRKAAILTSSTSQYANKKQEFVKLDDKKEDKKADEKKRDMSKVKCYNYKKEGHFAKDYKKAKVKDYNYYKIKMLLAKKDSDKQVLLAEDQAWMESKSDEISSSAEETIVEVAYYTSESETQYAKLKEEIYEYMIRYSALCDNDRQHRKKIGKQEILFDKISHRLVEMNNYVKASRENLRKRNKNLIIGRVYLDSFSNVRRPKQSSIIWKKKGSSNTSNVDLSSVSHLKLNKDVKRYSRKDLLSYNNSHLGETSSAYVCNDAMNVSCNSRMCDLFDENNLFIFDDESFKRSRENKIKFAYDYGNLNSSYVNEKINFEDDYFQDIINLDFEKIDSPFQQTSSLKPYVLNVILEKIIIDLEDEVVNLLEKQKVNMETIESLKSKSFESSEKVYSESKNQSENDCLVVENECDKEENSKVIAPGMFKLNVSHCISPISMSKSSCDSVMGCEDAFKTRLAVYKFEAAGTEEEQAKNFQWGLRRRGGNDNHRGSNNNNNYPSSNNRNSGNGRDQRNRGHQSNRSTNSGSQQSRGPSEGYFYPICLWIIDSGCSKHMTGNRALLTNFVKKFLGTVRFGNNDFAVIVGYGDVVIGSMTIKKVYYVEGLGHNLFSVGKFCNKGLEVAFQKSACFVRNEDGVDFLTGDRLSNLYTIALNEVALNSLTCLLAKASSSQSWLWHQRLSHLNFTTINNLVKNNLVQGLPKMKFEKDHLCSACEQGKIHQKHHKSKTAIASNKPLYLLHMDLCGSMRVESINRKQYVLVVVDDYSRYTWVFFLHSKDEASEVIICFIKKTQVNL
nr:retrovirus-related Pol polyprotein from transposon TNT 1-94 [Tanacetum cinerariifolium]